MSNEKGTIITAITKKIDELLPMIIKSNNQDLFGNILTSDVIEDPFLMLTLTKPKLIGVWQDLCQIEYKLRKEGMN